MSFETVCNDFTWKYNRMATFPSVVFRKLNVKDSFRGFPEKANNKIHIISTLVRFPIFHASRPSRKNSNIHVYISTFASKLLNAPIRLQRYLTALCGGFFSHNYSAANIQKKKLTIEKFKIRRCPAVTIILARISERNIWLTLKSPTFRACRLKRLLESTVSVGRASCCGVYLYKMHRQ